MRKPLELYLHIPFCVRKCFYCDFLSAPASEGVREHYVSQLLAEIRIRGRKAQEAGYGVRTVFMGGGTPSLLTPDQMERMMEALYQSFSVETGAEITAEANPGALSGELLKAFRRSGINRLSLGLQSVHDRELRELGRIHTFESFLKSFSLAREAGFDNLNIDLMSALPGQTEASWQDTLSRVAALSPEHLSAYSLIIEEGTPFYERYGEMEALLEKQGELSKADKTRFSTRLLLPGEEADRRMYHTTRAFLKDQGYERYEISNYAKPGFACRHNVGYWTGVPYLGLGLGAASLWEGERFSVIRSLEQYLALSEEEFAAGHQYEERHRLTKKEQMEEFMFLGLRLMRGVSAAEFEQRFGCRLEAVYGEQLSRLEEEALLKQTGSGRLRRYCLTEPGIDVSNHVLAAFLL